MQQLGGALVGAVFLTPLPSPCPQFGLYSGSRMTGGLESGDLAAGEASVELVPDLCRAG